MSQRIGHDGTTYSLPEPFPQDEAWSWWMPRAPDTAVVAVDGDHVCGRATRGPHRPGRGSHVATASFLVDPACHRRGIGTALGLHVIEWARSNGDLAIEFNAVVETNEPAVHLWRKLKFEILATVPAAFRHRALGLVGVHVMLLSLSPFARSRRSLRGDA